MAAVLLVAVVAAVVSYCHMQQLAERSGEQWRSHLVPLSVDGLIVAASLAIVDRRRHGTPAGWVPWFGLALGIVASLAANIAAARPELIPQIIAAWPPVALAVAVETLVIVLRGRDVAPRSAVGVVDVPPGTAPAAPKPAKVARPTDRTSRKRPSPDDRARLAVLLEDQPDIGRRTVMRELGVSEHHAKQLLADLRPVTA